MCRSAFDNYIVLEGSSPEAGAGAGAGAGATNLAAAAAGGGASAASGSGYDNNAAGTGDGGGSGVGVSPLGGRRAGGVDDSGRAVPVRRNIFAVSRRLVAGEAV